jgi:ribosomal protein S18 acetylase RimI-like enzyme
VILRPARPDDAPALAAILRTCFRVSLPFLPELHTAEQDLAYMAARLAKADPVWVAEVDGAPAGFITFGAGWIDHLYVHPDRQGRGIGPRLLAKALEDGTEKRLWTFQQNSRARRFYEARGFEALEFTDGAGNEEKTPDVLYRWPGRRV